MAHNDENKAKIAALIANARKQGYFPITKGRGCYPAHKCCECGRVAVLEFRNSKGRLGFRCFACGA